MRRSILVIVAMMFLAGFYFFTRLSYIKNIERIDKIVLYSIDGRDMKELESKKFDEYFHQHPVLGKVEFDDRSKIKQIATAVNQAVAGGDSLAKCFWPRHGVRMILGEQIIDLVICFECLQLKEFKDDSERVVPVGRKSEAELDAILRAADVALAPK